MATATKNKPVTPNPMIADGLATLDEASKFLRISRAKLYGLMDAGELRYCKIGKCRRIPWSEVRRCAAEALVGA